MARIVVEIAANAAQAIGETDKFEKSLGRLQSQLSRLEKLAPFANSIQSAARAERAIAATRDRIANLGKTLNTSLGSTTRSSNEAAMALTNLGRIAQDAPFGFIGIQNNLNPMLESFQRLSKETGSSTSALKTMGAVLRGPAGIGIALSVVSSAILFFQQYQQRTRKEVEETTKSLEEQRSEFIKGGYQKAVTDLNELTNKVSLAKQGFVDKNTVLKQYNEGIGKTIGKVTDLDTAEQLLIKNGPKYLQLMYLKANADFAFSKAAEESYKLQEKKYEIDKKGPQISEKFNINADRTNKVIEQQTINLRALLDSAQSVTPALDGVNTKFVQVNKNIAEQLADESQLKEIENKYTTAADLANKAQQAVLEFAKKNGLNLGGIFGVDESSIDKLNKDLLNGRKAFTDFFGETERAYQSFVKTVQGNDSIFGGKTSTNELTKQFQSTNTELSNFAENWKRTASQLGSTPLIPIESFKTGTTQFVSEAQIFTDKVNGILNTGIQDSMANFGMAIGDALANGTNVLQAAGASILGAIGEIAIRLGKLAIATGVAVEGIKKALQSLNPALAIAAGIALVALGSFVRSSAANIVDKSSSSTVSAPSGRSRIPGFASGVTNFEGGLAYVHAGELLTNLPTGANVIPKAKTNQILSGIGGGGNSWEVAGVLKGTDIELAVRRSVKNNNLI